MSAKDARKMVVKLTKDGMMPPTEELFWCQKSKKMWRKKKKLPVIA
jgi:hypothetical protein